MSKYLLILLVFLCGCSKDVVVQYDNKEWKHRYKHRKAEIECSGEECVEYVYLKRAFIMEELCREGDNE